MKIPRSLGLRWCDRPEAALTFPSSLPSILIERDFVRSAVEEPDDFDRFTNPRTGRQPPTPKS